MYLGVNYAKKSLTSIEDQRILINHLKHENKHTPEFKIYFDY